MRREGGEHRSSVANLIQIIRSQRESVLSIQEVYYRKGNTLYIENEPAYHAYLITEGFVDLVKRTPGGKRFILDRLGPGEVLGVEALMNRRDMLHIFCAEAITDVRALLLNLAVWEEIFTMREAHRTALQLLGQALLYRELRIGTLLPHGAPERIREVRQYLKHKFNGYAPHVTQREIAQFTGYTPETVSKSKKQPVEASGL